MEENNYERKIGVEIEFSNLALAKCCDIIVSLFGGEIVKNSRYDYEVKKSSIGDFHLELDAKLLKKLVLNPTFGKLTRLFGQKDELNDIIEKTASVLIPYEIVAPPVKISNLGAIEKLVDKLRLNGALGTTHAFQYAFGVHLNVEPPHMDVKTVLRTFQAFLFIQLWLERQTEVDITRKFSPFIEDFDKEFLLFVTNPSYKPNKEHFIKDYIAFNPTRNRVLDMLPLLAFWDKTLVRAKLPKEKINPRPTFHYRMPNSKIDLFTWSIANEFKLWQIVEKLAQSQSRFEYLRGEFRNYHNDLFHSKDEYLQKCHECITDLLSQ
jgi:hypothetical protein